MHAVRTALAVYFGLYACMLTASPTWKCCWFGMRRLGWGVFLGLNGVTMLPILPCSNWAMEHGLHVFDLLGTNLFNWKNCHVGCTTTCSPNIMNADSDIQQSDVVKIFPKDKHRSYCAQWLYMPVVRLRIYIFRWVVYCDLQDIFSPRLGGFDNRQYPAREIVKMLLFKLGYLGYIVVVPKLVLGFVGAGVWGVRLVDRLREPHHHDGVVVHPRGEHANFPEPDAYGVMPHSWSHPPHADGWRLCDRERLGDPFVWGLQPPRHPSPVPTHLPHPLSCVDPKILIRVAAKHGVEYRSEKHMFSAMYSHFKLLYSNGNPMNPNWPSHEACTF